VSGSSGVKPWRGGTEAKSSLVCGGVGGIRGFLLGEWALRFVVEKLSVRSGVRRVLGRVLFVNGETVLKESRLGISGFVILSRL
jgi:hypothetical protein